MKIESLFYNKMFRVLLILILIIVAVWGTAAPLNWPDWPEHPNGICDGFKNGSMIMVYNSTGNQIAFTQCVGIAQCLLFICEWTQIGGVYFTIELIKI
jgi:hypothetical protein